MSVQPSRPPAVLRKTSLKENDFLKPEFSLILKHSQNAFERLRGQRIFLTGGTGFIGSWLIKSFLHANQALDLKAEILVLSRDPEAFYSKWPELKNETALKLIQGDLNHLPTISGELHLVIHAATNASSLQSREDQSTFELNYEGTKQLFDLCAEKKIKKYLLTSSGAVYGEQPHSLELIDEDYPGAPNVLSQKATYGESKRVAEWLSVQAGRHHQLDVCIGRIFAVIGPHMPLNSSYAAGDFLGKALKNEPIHIKGDGTPLRNFIYIGDLVIWLWNLLIFGKNQSAYNLAGDEIVSILQLAQLTHGLTNSKSEIIVDQKPIGPPQRYLGSNQKIKSELNVATHWELKNALIRSAEWLKIKEQNHG